MDLEQNTKRVAAVVVTYNRSQLLKECIDCILAQSVADSLDILVIDNHSTDNTQEVLETFVRKGQIRYFDTGENLGGAGGFEYGLRIAADSNYGYVWVMDDDTMPCPDALERMFDAAATLDCEWGFISSRVLWKDGTVCTMNKQRATLTKNVDDAASGIIPVLMASFVSLLVPVRVIQELGLPIGEFFIWTDDWEFTRRISLRYRCFLATDSVVVHKCVSNHGANIAIDDVGRLGRYDYLYRNDVYLYRREGLKGFLYEAARLSGHLVRIVTKAPNNRIARMKAVFRGTKAGFSFDPVIHFPDVNNALNGSCNNG